MSLHYTPMILTAKATHQTADCGTGGVDSTSGGVFNGSVIDRLALGPAFTHAQPFLVGQLPGTTSTAGARYRSVAVKLRHGDSSGGGDLADFSTGLIPAAVPFYTTQGESTDWKNFTTGAVRLQTSHVSYPLLGAKRFITAAGTITGPGLTTATAAGNLVTAALGVAMVRGDAEGGPDLSMSIGGLRDVLPTTSTAT
jgi:hypothetical protein